MIKIFIGYDRVESVAYHTLVHSILTKSSEPVSITPINLTNFKKFYNKERDPKQSNEFSFSRFLVPYLCNYEGHAIFMDCDMMLREDIAKLWELAKADFAVQVCKHDYIPKDQIKYLGTKQYSYEKKNWSSMMLFNCAHPDCQKLTPEYIEEHDGMHLHQFQWVEGDIGMISREWNWLVGEYSYNARAKLVHWTIGGPYFNEYRNADYADEWFSMNAQMQHCLQREELNETQADSKSA